MVQGREVDIARRLQTIEWLKAELVGGVSALFKAMLKNGEDSTADALASVVMACYLLGRRLGVSFAHLDSKVQNKVKANISPPHDIEEWYGDFSALDHHLRERVQ